MKSEELQELKNKNAELIKKACVYTNLAYALVEVADSFIIDANSILNKLGAEISRDEKVKYKNTCRAGKTFKVWLKDLAKQIYKIDIAEDVLNDTDTLYDTIMLIMDRCGGKMSILDDIKKLVSNSFESQYKYYK